MGSDGQDKLRRGEDWRRGGQNSAAHAVDQPHHHTPDHYAAAADKVKAIFPDAEIEIWGHDHDGAYRQLPLNDPSKAFVMLQTPDGITLWRHDVLLFGAVSSVWGYNRFGDILSALSRIIFRIPAMHYVDDYGAVEPAWSSRSSFHTFKQFNEQLGWIMKESKAQPPADSQKMQGVYITATKTDLKISPCPNRVARLLRWFRNIIDGRSLPPEEARTLTGKLGFVAMYLFGKVGRCAMRALWTRAAMTDHHAPHSLNDAIETSIRSLEQILLTCPPRTIPWKKDRPHALIYTDAYFQLGEQVVKIGQARDFDWQSRTPSQISENGWGFIVIPDSRHPERALAMFGRVPDDVVKVYSGTKAFIYFLEALAAIIAPMMLRKILPDAHYSFVDNEAAKFALIKGYGKQTRVNNLIAAYWSFVTRSQSSPWFERVSSGANWADSVSRNDWSLVQKRGWTRLHARLNHVWPILIKIAKDNEFAHGEGTTQLEEALQAAAQYQLVQRKLL